MDIEEIRVELAQLYKEQKASKEAEWQALVAYGELLQGLTAEQQAVIAEMDARRQERIEAEGKYEAAKSALQDDISSWFEAHPGYKAAWVTYRKEKDIFIDEPRMVEFAIEHHMDFLLKIDDKAIRTFIGGNCSQDKKGNWQINTGFGEWVASCVSVGTNWKPLITDKRLDENHTPF